MHASVFEVVKRRVVAGERPRAFIPELLAEADRAYDMLEAGL
ncbi:hypothetical protein [Candidatus Solirubrobacter pratensis]